MAFDIHKWQAKQWKADRDNTLNEAMYTYLGPKGENGPITMKVQVAQFIKKKGGNKKGYFLVAAKHLNKAKKLYQKYRGNFKNADFQDDMFDLMYENIVSEAGMDKRFMQDWEKSTKALLNHMKHEYDELTRTGDHMRKKNAYKWLRGAMKDVDKVTGYAAQMAKFFGTE